ncbi:hypothetical protein CEXT_654721 [Caerostris extrusa]|uniref:Uncharacterized protein n=1 Tax=Caerostris extrusa TaxID=172846 RepID=A0AAV4V9J2_CAEEX|nr:hypothetical protein CEXT_654721 [Caerostris extrusa]
MLRIVNIHYPTATQSASLFRMQPVRIRLGALFKSISKGDSGARRCAHGGNEMRLGNSLSAAFRAHFEMSSSITSQEIREPFAVHS